MERFWTLQYVQQNGITELVATVFKDNMVRADDLPLVLAVSGAQGLARGTQVRVRLGAMDLLTLDISGTVLERLAPAQAQADEESLLAQDEDEVAGPITIALDVNDSGAAE